MVTREEEAIGSSPCDEACAQVGDDGYELRARAECRMFVEAIEAALGHPPVGAQLVIKSSAHDFGRYLEVVVRFDPENEAAVDYAYRVQDQAPTRWTDEQRARLAGGAL